MKVQNKHQRRHYAKPMLAFVAVVKRSLNTKKVSIVLIVYMNVRCQAIDANICINAVSIF